MFEKVKIYLFKKKKLFCIFIYFLIDFLYLSLILSEATQIYVLKNKILLTNVISNSGIFEFIQI
jgi:hypothetical protein